MRQSNFIFGALAVAFVVFITTRGSLSTYLSVIFGTAAAPASPSGLEQGETIGGAIGGAIAGPVGKYVGGSLLGGVGAIGDAVQGKFK